MKKRILTRILSLVLALLVVVSAVSCSSMGANSDGEIYMPSADANMNYQGNNDEYTEITENGFISTADNPNSYFSIDANTASYPNLRNMIQNNYHIDKDAVRIEEMLNYFDYDYKAPENSEILALNASLFDTPYNSETKLLTVGLAAEKVDLSNIKNNLVFLVDVSGSMYSDDKLPLVQSAFKLLTESLKDVDRISIVTYAGRESVVLSGAYGYEKDKIMAAIEDLKAGGSTAGSAGIKKAYEIANQYFIEGGNNRVILATDGDFNVGINKTEDLEKFIAEKRETGVYFSAYCVGRGNVKYEKMEALALAGNGIYSYIDSVNEAKRALVTDIGGSLVTVAKDVKAGITFNGEYIDSYRLIGYENKLLTEEEFEDSSTDAGELGSGHTVTVVYEIKLKNDIELTGEEEIAEVNIKYKPTENVGADGTVELLNVLKVRSAVYKTAPDTNDLFVASVIEFGLILRDSSYKADADLASLISRLDQLDLANDSLKEEFRKIVKLYSKNKG